MYPSWLGLGALVWHCDGGCRAQLWEWLVSLWPDLGINSGTYNLSIATIWLLMLSFQHLGLMIDVSPRSSEDGFMWIPLTWRRVYKTVRADIVSQFAKRCAPTELTKTRNDGVTTFEFWFLSSEAMITLDSLFSVIVLSGSWERIVPCGNPKMKYCVCILRNCPFVFLVHGTLWSCEFT